MAHEVVITTVIAVVALLLVAAAAAIGFRRINLPFTVGLVLTGLLLGAVAERVHELEFLSHLTLSPEIILFIFLPTLIFESAFNLDSRLLSRNLRPVLTLAAPGLLLSTGLVGGLMAWLTPLELGPAVIFGALISATDPVAVIALFKQVGAPKRLATLVEGESLFNDATAIVLFRVILAVVGGGVLTASTFGRGFQDFAIVFTGGLLVGGLIGYLMIRSIALADDDPLVEVALSTVVAYAAFIAAEHYLHVSGVMATVGAGLVVGTLGSTRFTPQAREYLHQFWEYAAFVANSLIFLLVGLSIPVLELGAQVVPILIAIGAVMLARAVTVFGLVPVVGRLPGSEPIDLRYQSVMFWGGLRGAVALALALSLPEGFAQRDLVVTLAIGVVLFSLLSGGLTMGPLIRLLGLDRPSLVERVASAQASFAAKRQALERMTELASVGHFSPGLMEDTQFRYRGELEAAERDLDALRGECTEGEIRSVLWSEALAAEQTVYRNLFGQGAISEPVLRELELSVELQRDRLKQGDTPRGVPEAAPIEMRLVGALSQFLIRVAPRNGFVQRQRLRGLAARYEHDLAVFEAGRRVAEEVARLGELLGVSESLTASCREEYRRRSEEATKRLDQVAEHFPEYVQAMQQQTAGRIALDGEAQAIRHLGSSGALPGGVAANARRTVERALRRLARQPITALQLDPRDLLGRVPMFQGLAPEDFQRVVDALVPRTVLADEVILTQGERGTSLFLIARGVVAVSIAQDGGPPARVAALYAGDFFGEMALLTSQPRSATVRAVTDCQLYELSKRDVDQLCEVCPGVKSALSAAYAERAGVTQREERRSGHWTREDLEALES